MLPQIARRTALSAAAAPRSVRTFASTAPTLDFARMQLLGRLTADPEVRTSVNGKEFVRYTVATSDPPGPPSTESGERPPETTSFHNVFAFGEGVAERLARVTKGTRVLVDAEFRLAKQPPVEEGGQASTQVLVSHRKLTVISKPRSALEQGEEQ